MVVDFNQLSCPDLAVSKDIIEHIVRIESAFNPYAIGVVGGRLARQPKNLPEALATTRQLEKRGYNFSLGLAQVNRYNLRKYGIHSYASAFDQCTNLKAGSQILAECKNRLGDWGKAFSCYYSGNPVTGFQHGYVQKVFASINQSNADVVEGAIDDALAIAVIDNPSRARLAKRTAATPSAVATLPARLIARAASSSSSPLSSAQRVSSNETARVQTSSTASRRIVSAPQTQPADAADDQAPVVLRAGKPAAAKAIPAAAVAVSKTESTGPDDAFVF